MVTLIGYHPLMKPIISVPLGILVGLSLIMFLMAYQKRLQTPLEAPGLNEVRCVAPNGKELHESFEGSVGVSEGTTSWVNSGVLTMTTFPCVIRLKPR